MGFKCDEIIKKIMIYNKRWLSRRAVLSRLKIHIMDPGVFFNNCVVA